MFSIFKKKYPKQQLDLSQVKADMHSHLLPGIDDGSPDLITSLELIRGLQDTGLSHFTTTPHILWDLYKNTPESIAASKGFLLHELSLQQMQIPLHAAAEYLLDDHVMDLLHQQQPLLTIYKNYVLVEFSFVSASLNWKDEMFQLQINGYQPVLAHPERYAYLHNHKKIFDDMKDMGLLFQANLLSFTGYYTKQAKDMANYLLQKNYYDFVGTDLHHHCHLEAMRYEAHQIMPAIDQLLASGKLQNGSLVDRE